LGRVDTDYRLLVSIPLIWNYKVILIPNGKGLRATYIVRLANFNASKHAKGKDKLYGS
jgi:hypothetical protein